MNAASLLPRRYEAQAARLRTTPVAVLLGGRSSEREVSLKSGAAVLRALEGGPLASLVALEIEPDGRWQRAGRSLRALEVLAELPRETLFFLALHGGEGEDGSVQGLLETQGFRHTGAGVGASALCMDKQHTRAVLAAAGLRVARGRLVHPLEWRTERARVLAELEALAVRGCVVKPNRGGSSVDTFVLEDAAGIQARVERVLQTGDLALVEERLDGVEATCGVLGNARDELRALPPVEIVPKPGRFFDYEEKYSAAGAAEFCPPRSLGEERTSELRDLARRAHRAAGCDGYSRTDFFVPAEGQPVVLEINTLPGLTDRSLLPLSAAVEGFGFPELCLEILALALERGR
ncbi:MAG: D-alanine--D-alanine ligase [Planctomycetes bacterium]|nr:D-alanine--D-alanine ligase [Planctomycetota bacterium]